MTSLIGKPQHLQSSSQTINQEATISFEAQAKLIIKAVFKKLPQTFNLSLTSSHADRGSVSGSGSFEEGTLVNIYAIPKSGYEFWMAWDWQP